MREAGQVGLRPGNDLRHNDVVKNMGQSGAARAATKDSASRTHAGAEQSTRARVARLIMENGPVTAAALGTRLGLTPAAVRRHLDHLLTDGMIQTRVARAYGNPGPGRPAKMFPTTHPRPTPFHPPLATLPPPPLPFL